MILRMLRMDILKQTEVYYEDKSFDKSYYINILY
jgi:hypothetical protein